MACGCNGMPKVKPTGAPCGCRSKSLPRSRLLDEIAEFPVLDDPDIGRQQLATVAEILKQTDYPPPRTLLARAALSGTEESSACQLGPSAVLRPTLVESPVHGGVGRVIRGKAVGQDHRNLRLQVLAPLWELARAFPARAPEAASVACDPCEPELATASIRLSCESQIGPDDSVSEDFTEPPQQREPDAAARDACTTDPCAASALAGGRPILKAAEASSKPAPSCPEHETKEGDGRPVDPVTPNFRGKGSSEVPCPCTCKCISLPRFEWLKVPAIVNLVVAGTMWFWQRRAFAMPDLLWLLDSMGFSASWLAPRASSMPGGDGDAALDSIAGGFVPSMSPLAEGADLGLGRFTGLDLTALRPIASEPSEFSMDREARITLMAPTHPELTGQLRVPFSTPLSPDVAEDLAMLTGGSPEGRPVHPIGEEAAYE